MYRRNLTRIEIKLEDVTEYEKIKKENELQFFEVKGDDQDGAKSSTEASQNQQQTSQPDPQQIRHNRIGFQL